LRHDDPVVAHGDFTMLLPDDLALYAFTRTLEGTTLLVVANLSDSPVDVREAGLPDAEAWLGGERSQAEIVLDSGPRADPEWVLPPWAARVRRRAAPE